MDVIALDRLWIRFPRGGGKTIFNFIQHVGIQWSVFTGLSNFILRPNKCLKSFRPFDTARFKIFRIPALELNLIRTSLVSTDQATLLNIDSTQEVATGHTRT
jgi:hypothetical protein